MSDSDLEKSLRLSLMALRDIVASRDCDYIDAPEREQLKPCPCAKCIARDVLDLVGESGHTGGWRYRGAHADRVKNSPRERKIIEAWRGQVNDRTLGLILTDDPGRTFQTVEQPSIRDWYVATSVVQWLATNVGMEVLRRAGFEYMQHDADRKEREKREDANAPK